MPLFRVPVAAIGREKAGFGSSSLKDVGLVTSLLTDDIPYQKVWPALLCDLVRVCLPESFTSTLPSSRVCF